MLLSKDIFCNIVDKQLPAFVVAENELAIAFLDREPATEGHTLIIPKRHANDIFDISEKEIIAITKLAQQVGMILQKTFGYPSIILHQVNGESAQDVRHFHLHIYGGPKITPYFYEQFLSKKEIEDSLVETQSKFVSNR